MRVEFSISPGLGRRLAFPLFIAMLALCKMTFPTAALVAVLIPSLRMEFSMGWCHAILVAGVVWLSTGVAKDQLGIMAGKFIRDWCRSRLSTLAYAWLGGLVQLADDAAPLPAVTRPGPREVMVVRTAKHTGERLKVLAPLFLAAGVAPKGEPAVVLDAQLRYQTFMGFGGSFTESSADLLLKMSPANQERILEAYFSPEKGLGYSVGRLHMNSCDFSVGNWSCADMPGDRDLKSFTIERYQASMIPMVKRAEKVAGKPLTLFASPWSPPAWMKDNDRMLNGGKLRVEYRDTWARFYVRFAQELKAAGVELWGFTVQNEPHAETPWENCIYTNEEERDFVRDHLGPALNASGLGLKLIVWDHNRDDMFVRAKTIYDDPEAAQYVWGVGYHWYGDPEFEIWPAREGMVLNDNLQRVHELRPAGHIIMTEACQEFGPRIGNWRLGERYGEALIKDLNRWLEAWVDWNLILDSTGGPNHVGNLVSAPVIADNTRDKVLFLSSYYYLGHFSRYIQPGAQRIAAVANRDAIEVTAFANPDGTIAVVVQNQRDYTIGFWLELDRHSTRVEAPAHSISTLILRGGA